MNKTASQIAEEVLLKVACLELEEQLTKEGAPGPFEGFGPYIAAKLTDRIGRRIAVGDQETVTKLARNLLKKFRELGRNPQNKKIAPKDWYRPLYDNSGETPRIMGYAVGHENRLTSILAPDMVVKGERF